MDEGQKLLVIAVVLVSAFASGSGLVCFTVLSRHGVSSGSQLYLTMGLGTCFSIAVAASVGAFDVPPEKGLAAWLSVLCVCVFGTLATLFMSTLHGLRGAPRLGDHPRPLPRARRGPQNFVWDAAVFGKSVGVASVAGAGLICVGVLILTLSPRVEQSTNGVGVHEGDQPAGGGAPSHGSDKLLPPGVPRLRPRAGCREPEPASATVCLPWWLDAHFACSKPLQSSPCLAR